MQSEIPPIDVREPASHYQHFKVFASRQEAVDFIEKNGGMLVPDDLRKNYVVIRVPAEK